MSVLLISSNFFGYPQEIIRALEARGRKVVWFDDRPATDTLTKGLIRLSPKLIERRSAAYFDDVFRKAAAQGIRDVLVIKGEAMSIATIQRMRAMFPDARHTLYFWDSFRNMPAGSADKIDLFDRAFSFDVEDVKADPRLTYRPLFYIERYADVGGIEQDIDVLFIGTAHSDRVAVLDRLKRAMPAGYDFRRILYVRSALLHRIQQATSAAYRRIDPQDFIFSPIPKTEVQQLIGRARIVVDIERSIQTGYTMRTIEMLGSGRKLLTTNPSVRTADFYHPQNQHYVDREAPVIDPAFLRTPWHPQDPALLQRYSLSGWLDTVLG
ncbi:CgeB family protein [Sphingomonas sanguinis]|uniref:Lipopolysaccharide biosynthesis protein n=2 Tax=Sphingomonas sanguinis TaxID=33051 RepID=A0A7Y7QYF4_9SPHN|nr:hypothetical protein [Sphingomonas sanguinis]MBZ6383761.1 hypothetical protein [Sphingomonas sanguinis]NNG52757.1 hypothetical protein [Sphingomonas sanguinis]NVP33052.1 hypothetical protein [Sphingomonas sanguinis]